MNFAHRTSHQAAGRTQACERADKRRHRAAPRRCQGRKNGSAEERQIGETARGELADRWSWRCCAMRDFGEHSPRFCSEERATGGNPARGIKKPPIRKMERFLSDDEIARLSAALEFEATSSGNPYASAAIKLLLLTGCRRGEILNLYGRMLTSKGNAFVSQTARRARRLSISTRPHLSYSGVSRTLRVTPMSLCHGEE